MDYFLKKHFNIGFKQKSLANIVEKTLYYVFDCLKPEPSLACKHVVQSRQQKSEWLAVQCNEWLAVEKYICNSAATMWPSQISTVSYTCDTPTLNCYIKPIYHGELPARKYFSFVDASLKTQSSTWRLHTVARIYLFLIYSFKLFVRQPSPIVKFSRDFQDDSSPIALCCCIVQYHTH